MTYLAEAPQSALPGDRVKLVYPPNAPVRPKGSMGTVLSSRIASGETVLSIDWDEPALGRPEQAEYRDDRFVLVERPPTRIKPGDIVEIRPCGLQFSVWNGFRCLVVAEPSGGGAYLQPLSARPDQNEGSSEKFTRFLWDERDLVVVEPA